MERGGRGVRRGLGGAVTRERGEVGGKVGWGEEWEWRGGREGEGGERGGGGVEGRCKAY